VKRVYEPGCKFDEMVVLVGKQGTGKSTILARLGGKWFSDSLKNFENKEAGEHLQNGWIFEIGEMQAMKKAEVESVKAFLSKTEDRYRVAYDRQVSEFPRKCVFFGTTNNREFLVDDTGNRRFFPIEVAMDNKVDWADVVHSKLTEDVVHQIWAEARHYYLQGESLTIDREAKEAAVQKQEEHYEEDPRAAGIRAWLDKLVEDEFGGEPYYHNQVCAAQVWVECLHRRIGDLNKWESRLLCSILSKTEGWEEDGRRTMGEYGKVTAFKRTSFKNL
jgi:predicted P-loop ATPase